MTDQPALQRLRTSLSDIARSLRGLDDNLFDDFHQIQAISTEQRQQSEVCRVQLVHYSIVADQLPVLHLRADTTRSLYRWHILDQ